MLSTRFFLVPLYVAALANSAPAGINVWTSGGPQDAVVTALAVDPTTAGIVYAGTAGQGVFRTTDGGVTWQTASVGLGDTYVESVVVDPNQPTTLYAASPNRGVFKSSDRGASWAAVNDGLPSPSGHLLAFDATRQLLYVSTNDGVFTSIDAADNWEATGLATRDDQTSGGDPSLHAWIDCLVVDPTSGAVYACFFSWGDHPGPAWGLLRSVDSGASWHDVDLGMAGGPVALAMDPATPGIMHAVLYDPETAEYRVSTVGGTGWAPGLDVPMGCDGPERGLEERPAPAACRIHGLAVDGARDGAPKTLYAATDSGVYASVEGSSDWTPLNTGIAGQMVTNVVVDPKDPAVLYAATSSGVFALRQAPRCFGDCNGDATVRVAELVSMVDIALGRDGMAMCAAGDVDRDGTMAVSEVVVAVDRALMGCAD